MADMTTAERDGLGMRFSASAAAKATGTPRSTLLRWLDTGKFPNATKDDEGWSIPLADLLAVGLNPGKPSAADPPSTQVSIAPSTGDKPQVHGQDHVADGLDHGHVHRIELLSAQLADTRVELASERALRKAAEMVAEERSERVADLRTAMKALEAAAARPATDPVAPTSVTETDRKIPAVIGIAALAVALSIIAAVALLTGR